MNNLFCPSSLSLLVYYADCRISKEQCYIAREPKARQLQEHIVSTITPSFSDCYLIKKISNGLLSRCCFSLVLLPLAGIVFTAAVLTTKYHLWTYHWHRRKGFYDSVEIHQQHRRRWCMVQRRCYREARRSWRLRRCHWSEMQFGEGSFWGGLWKKLHGTVRKRQGLERSVFVEEWVGDILAVGGDRIKGNGSFI